MAAPSGCIAATSTSLPDGAFVALEEGAWAVRGNVAAALDAQGLRHKQARPRGTMVDVLTPPAIVGVLAAGYRPRWHPSAEAISSPP